MPMLSSVITYYHILSPNILVCNPNIVDKSTPVRGHPFMTSTRRGSGSGGRTWTGSSSMWTSTQKIKLESTDVILSSSHAKKLASFFTRMSSLDIFLQYKLVI